MIASDWDAEVGVNYAPPSFVGANAAATAAAAKEAPPPDNPRDPLRDETPPDVRHPKRTMRRQIEQWIRGRPPRRILAVEWAPGTGAEGDAHVRAKFLRQRKSHPVNRVHIGIAIRESLLDRTGDLFARGTQIRRRLMDRVQRKTARPDVGIGKVAVDVDPTGGAKSCIFAYP